MTTLPQQRTGEAQQFALQSRIRKTGTTAIFLLTGAVRILLAVVFQLADSSAIALTRDDVACGDLVAYREQWFPALRVNAKSVSVRSLTGDSWTDTIPYHQISGHRPKQV